MQPITKCLSSTKRVYFILIASVFIASCGGGASVNKVPSSSLPPRLAFSDLISGPDTGLGDGQGSGVIVTVWGQNLGAQQGSSKVTFIDSANVERDAAHIYYWKNADGILPGGPANLYESHRMQEIAFSIPASAPGAGFIRVTVNGQSSTLPFTVRAGNIHHVMLSGNDSSGNGSFANPWFTINKALTTINSPGATTYVHDSIATGGPAVIHGVYWSNTQASSGLNNQYGIIAFPDSQPTVTGIRAFSNYQTTGKVVSKFEVFASNCDEDPNGQPVNCVNNTPTYGIQTSAYGRAIGNTITDQSGGCANGQQGAINGNTLNGDRVSAVQILGNEIYDYGCVGSTKFHHTTYLSIRSGNTNLQVDPWRLGWNYLHGNQTKNGLHMYDENLQGTLCGSPNSTVIVNDNVVVNQAGAGIFMGANCPWTNDFEVYNNVLINTALVSDWDGIDPKTANSPHTGGITINGSGLMDTVYIYNNTIHTWSDDDSGLSSQACLGFEGGGDNVTVFWENNICYTDKDKKFIGAGCCGATSQLDNVSGYNNAWYYSGINPNLAIPPTWDTAPIIGDPLLKKLGSSQLSVGAGSPLIGNGLDKSLSHDVYGVPRLSNSSVGAIE